MNESQPIPETLAALVELYIASNLGVKSVQTMKLYKYTIRRFDQFLGRPSTLADFTDVNVAGFIRRREADGMKAATCEREGNKLLCLWRWAALRGWCAHPMMHIGKIAPSTPTAWSRQELHKLFAAAESYTGEIFGLPGWVYFTALLRVLWDSGERIGAVGLLKWSDLDLSGRWVTFRKETRKGRGKSSDNLQRLSGRTVRALEQLKEHCFTIDPDRSAGRLHVWLNNPRANKTKMFTMTWRDPLTGKNASKSTGTADRLEAERIAAEWQVSMREQVRQRCAELQPPNEADALVFVGAQWKDGSSPQSLYHHMKRILRNAGLPCDSRSMFHRIRRTHATHLYVVGGDPTASLGHYNDQMTRDYYLDPRYTRNGYAADLLSGGILQLLRRFVRRVKVALGFW